jgi:hypothetical protein
MGAPLRAVWSFWSKPFLAQTGWGWYEPLHHLLAWGLSHHLARRHYAETVLVTDDYGQRLLVDRLGLRFTHVSTELERLRRVDADWWVLGKLVAYRMQDKPFVHLDNDVFLWRPLPAHLIEADVFSQCPEDHAFQGWHGQEIEDAFARHGVDLPVEWEWSRSQSSTRYREENTGIFGGTRTDFVRHYASVAVDLVLNPAHATIWAQMPTRRPFNWIVEQFLCTACADYHRLHPESSFRGIRVRHLFGSMGEAFDPAATSRAGYTHLMGDAKSNAKVARRLEERVRQEDPVLFARCVRMTRGAA